jgi:hypothetical protein
LRQFINHPVVLVTLFLACVAVIVWSFWFREPAEDRPAPAEPARLSEAHRFYQLGQRLYRSGDRAGAREVWTNLVRSFQGVESEEEWVDQAKQGLAKVEPVPAEDERWKPVTEALKQARTLRDQGNRKRAEEIWSGIEGLYWNEPAARKVLKQVQEDRGK